MEAVIVEALPRHIPQLAVLEKQCFSLPWTEQQLASQLKDDRHEFIVALDGRDQVLGYVGMTCVLDEGYIANVAVSPLYRRQGIADALIDKLCDIAQERALSFLTLEVRAGNAPAIALYEKHGFGTVGRRKNYYDFPKEDAILMTKFWNRGINIENSGF
ncbi:MAG: ribosomal protein S18-alanine N-acetyltransferase [Oscillospiraceae bacterium]|nr:ribosomal protein S18-alanine N-acetyltransferase [Oscillospiraceae bacterium]